MKAVEEAWADDRKEGCVEREIVIRDINSRIEQLARIQPQYRLRRSEEFNELKDGISKTIRSNGINTKSDLEPHIYNLYRRYFD